MDSDSDTPFQDYCRRIQKEYEETLQSNKESLDEAREEARLSLAREFELRRSLADRQMELAARDGVILAAGNENTWLKKLLNEKNQELESQKAKETVDLSDQLAFFQAELAKKDETLVKVTDELRRLNELLNTNQEEMKKLKAELHSAKSAAEESSMEDLDETASILDPEDMETSQQRRRRRKRQNQRKRKAMERQEDDYAAKTQKTHPVPGDREIYSSREEIQVSVNSTTKVASVPNSARNREKQSVPRVPPIIIREKAKYCDVAAALEARSLDFGKATTLPEGVKLQPVSTDAFRGITKFLDENNVEYHSFPLQEEKLLHVVLRGVLETFSVDDIRTDLEQQGFHPNKVVRWYHKDKRPMPLVLVLLPKSDNTIFQLTQVKRNKVTVESQRPRSRVTQCHNCQLFGHSSYKCKASPKCVKCGEGHKSSVCKKPRDVPAKCVNCGGPHPASFLGCKMHPKHRTQGTQPSRKGIAENSVNPESIGNAMKMIHDMNEAMQTFFSNLKNMQRQINDTVTPLFASGSK